MCCTAGIWEKQYKSYAENVAAGSNQKLPVLRLELYSDILLALSLGYQVGGG
jgi:hypothetical protein